MESWGRIWWWATLVLFPLCIHGCFGCWEEERIGLLQFKASSDYPHKWPLSSWSSTNQERDCCRWERVYCHNTTGRVIQLDLSVLRPNYSFEHWYLNASLFLPFEELNSLDLSFNGIYGWVPNEGLERFSGLSKLEELTLDWNSINDSFLSSIGAIASLRKLSLDMNLVNGKIHIPELGRLNKLQELYLDHSQTDKNILQRAGNMTSLNALSIKGCGLQGWPCELSNLQELDLGENDFEGMLPSCLANMTALRLLSIPSNHFNGSISHIFSLPSLEYLDLSNNHFAPISFSSFSNISRLKILIIDNLVIDEENVSQPWAPSSQLYVVGLSGCLSRRSSGTVPNFLRYQYQLRVIDLSHNNLSGSFPNWMLENNPNLEVLHFRNNSFKGPFHVPDHPNPHIWRIDISHNHIGGPIPGNLGSVFPNLENLNMSGNEFEGRIPSSLSDLASLKFLDFSNNHLSGTIPEHLAMGCYSLRYLKLSNNNFSGELFPTPLFSLTSLLFLYLDNNNFSGKIPNCLSNIVSLFSLNLSDNNLTGMLPRWLGNMSSLKSIVMANNKLEGPIPRELCKLNDLKFLDLSENHLSGPIPFCFNSSYIKHVHLQKNSLRGPLPSAFKGNSTLVTLDLSYNRLTGYLPDWIGNLSSLSILLLRHNYLRGRISPHLCRLGRLSMLDLAENRFSGQIPPCLGNITFEVTDTKSNLGSLFFSQNYRTHQYSDFPYLRIKLQGSLKSYLVLRYAHEIVEVVQEVEFTTKRRRDIYKGNILNYMSGIDLSSNKLTGEIPHELGNLSNIHVLNLSYNSLTGSIPITFSKLDQIESLDLSNNDLGGVIPSQLVELNSLAVFSVAHNNLSGRTPERKAQFETFEKSSYEENPFLCGPPLNACNDVPEPPYAAVPTDKEGGEGDSFMDMSIFYISFVVSYAVVVLAIGAILWINPYWRRAWFYFIEVCMTNCYCFVVINLRKLRNFKTE